VKPWRGFLITFGTLLMLFLEAGVAGAVQLTMWDWHEPRATLTREFAAIYMQENPHVDIEISLQTGGPFREKLIVALAAGATPDIVQVHNEWAEEFAGEFEPYPEILFPRGELQSEYLLFDMTSTIDDSVYFLPVGIMTGAIYYNKGILEAAGYDRPPVDWPEFGVAARRLTRIESDGSASQGGFLFLNDFMWFWTDLVYQYGGTLLTDRGVTFATEAFSQGGEILLDLKNAEVHPAGVSFEAGNAAMRYQWTWYEAFARNLGFDYGVSVIPTPTGEPLPARGRNNVELGLAVFKDITPEKKDEAFRFIRWLFDNEEYIVKLNLSVGTIPSRTAYWDRDEIINGPAMQALVQQAPYTVFPGAVKSWYWNLLSEAAQRVQQGEPLTSVLQDAQRQGDAKFSEDPIRSVEHLYAPPAR